MIDERFTDPTVGQRLYALFIDAPRQQRLDILNALRFGQLFESVG